MKRKDWMQKGKENDETETKVFFKKLGRNDKIKIKIYAFLPSPQISPTEVKRL